MRRNNFHFHELKRIASALEKLVEMLEKGKKRRQLRKRRVNAPSIPVRNEATDSGKVNNGVSGQVKRRANLSFEDLIRRSGIKVVRPLGNGVSPSQENLAADLSWFLKKEAMFPKSIKFYSIF